MAGTVTNLKTVASLEAGKMEVKQMLDGLSDVWTAFEGQLAHVPVVKRIETGTLSMEDYLALLLNLRQQAVDCSQWIAMAAANVSEDYLDLRSKFLRHAVTEHRDFQLLEDDYAAAGGSLQDIPLTEKNVGCEALTAFMFHRASKPDPFAILGAMYVIEGVGAFKAAQWARSIREALRLPNDRPGYLIHHGDYDGRHLGDFEIVLGRVGTSPRIRAEIIKTARVVARLYLLQLECIDEDCC